MVPKVLPEIETLKAKLERGADLTLGPRIESKFRAELSARQCEPKQKPTIVSI